VFSNTNSGSYERSQEIFGLERGGSEEFAKSVTLSEDGTRVMIKSDLSQNGPYRAVVYESNQNGIWSLVSSWNAIESVSASRDVMTVTLISSTGELMIGVLLCKEDYRVQSHTCVPCDIEDENVLGDDPREENTVCTVRPTTTTTTAPPTTTTTAAPTTTTTQAPTTTTQTPTTTTETPATTSSPEEESSDETIMLIAMAGGGAIGSIILVVLCVFLCKWRGRKAEIVRIQRDLTIDTPTPDGFDEPDPSGMFDL